MAEPRTRIVGLVAAPRSGTHFLHSLLSDHPDVCFYSEVMHERAKQPEERDPERPLAFFFQWLHDTHGHTDLSGSAARDMLWTTEYFAALRAHHAEPVVGVDLKYWTWASCPPGVLRGIEVEVEAWIHLVRLDLLRAAASDALRGLRSTHPDLPADVTVVLPDPDALLKVACQRAAEITVFRKVMQRRASVELIYERLFDNPRLGGSEIRPSEQARLLRGLGLDDPGRPLRSGRRRENPPDMGDRIENWPELQATLRPRLTAWLQANDMHDLAMANRQAAADR